MYIDAGLCEHTVVTSAYNNPTCDRSARFKVGDSRYCLQHTNMVKGEHPEIRVLDLPTFDEPTEPCIRCGDPTFKWRKRLLDKTVCANCTEPLESVCQSRRLGAIVTQTHLSADEITLAFDIWEALYRFKFNSLPGPEALGPSLSSFVAAATQMLAAQKEKWREEEARRKQAERVETALDNEVETRVERLKVMNLVVAEKRERFALNEILRDEGPEFGHRGKIDWRAIQKAARWRLGEVPTFPSGSAAGFER